MVSTNENPEPQSRRQPSIPETKCEVRQPRQKAQLHRPLRRSRSIPRESMENIRRRARDFGETSDSNGVGGHISNQTNRHSYDGLSRNLNPADESCDALLLTTAKIAANSRLNTRSTERRHLQVLNMSCRKKLKDLDTLSW